MLRSLPFAAVHDRPAVIVPVQAGNADELVAMGERAHATPGIDVLEWRVDALGALSAVGRAGEARDTGDVRGAAWERALAEIRECGRALAGFTIPVLATVRTAAEGGPVALGEDAYTGLVTEIVAARPAAVDVEYLRRDAAELFALAREAGVYSVASFHDFSATPTAERLKQLVAGMERSGASVAKFAVTPATMAEVLRVMEVSARATGAYGAGADGVPGPGADAALVDIPVVAIAMGVLGQITRIAGDFGTAATFAALGSGSAPGQLSVPDTLEIFRARGQDA